MVLAIGSGSCNPSPVEGSSAGVLEAQLTRYQIQLADWCSCPSGKTPEGMATIQRIQNQLDAVKAQLARIAATKRQQAPTGPPADLSHLPRGATDGLKATGSPIGGLLDTFA